MQLPIFHCDEQKDTAAVAKECWRQRDRLLLFARWRCPVLRRDMGAGRGASLAIGLRGGMAFRDNLAKLRGLANETGYRVEKAPIRDCWFLVNETTGHLAISSTGAYRIPQSQAFRQSAGNLSLRRALSCSALGPAVRQACA